MDKDALYGLYTDDYLYIEEMFDTTLQHYDADFLAVEMAYQQGSLEDLKKAVHKIKPTFGFVGLTLHQDACRQFEYTCENAVSVTELHPSYIHIKNLLLEAKDIIEHEYLRLKAFNAHSL